MVEAGLGTGVLEQDAASRLVPAVAMPATLHEALLARLDRLGSAKGVVQLGATRRLYRCICTRMDEAGRHVGYVTQAYGGNSRRDQVMSTTPRHFLFSA